MVTLKVGDPSVGAPRSVYDQVGGMEFFERLVERFYVHVAADPPLLAHYPEPDDLAPARASAAPLPRPVLRRADDLLRRAGSPPPAPATPPVRRRPRRPRPVAACDDAPRSTTSAPPEPAASGDVGVLHDGRAGDAESPTDAESAEHPVPCPDDPNGGDDRHRRHDRHPEPGLHLGSRRDRRSSTSPGRSSTASTRQCACRAPSSRPVAHGHVHAQQPGQGGEHQPRVQRTSASDDGIARSIQRVGRAASARCRQRRPAPSST